MKPVARVRAKPAETLARVERIIDMMQRLDWVKGVSGPMLASEWGLAVGTVEDLAAEASRIVRREAQRAEDRGETQLGIGANMRALHNEMTERALAETDSVKAAKLATAAAISAREATSILGERAPTRVEVKGSAFVAGFEGLSPIEQAKKWRELAAKCVAEAERIERAEGIVDVPMLPPS